nr:pseudouridine synthase [bacterium]
MQQWQAGPRDGGRPLLQVLCLRYPAVSQSIWRKAFRARDIRINGRPAREQDCLAVGDVVRVAICDEWLAGLPRISTLYRDQRIWVVDKPAGYAVCAADAPGEVTVEQALAAQAAALGLPAPIACHRLDVYTGGTLLFALNPKVAWDSRVWFSDNLIERGYTTYVAGCPPKQLAAVHYAVKDAAGARVRVLDTPAQGAKRMALTAQKTGQWDGFARMDISLQTGRTHQIRAQMAYLGYPVLGDDKYGNRQVNHRMKLRHPVLWHTHLGFVRLPAPYEDLNGMAFTSPPRFPARLEKMQQEKEN